MENQTFEIKIVESVHYHLKVSAKSLKEAKAIAKDIKDGHSFITDYYGGDTPVHYGKIKAKVTGTTTEPKETSFKATWA